MKNRYLFRIIDGDTNEILHGVHCIKKSSAKNTLHIVKRSLDLLYREFEHVTLRDEEISNFNAQNKK
jgi:hypothetical protein